MFDPEPWLSPIDGDNPSGISLRNDLRFHELERLMQPRVEIMRDDRNNAVAQTPVPVNWSAVLELAGSLQKSGRDMRLLVIVVRALANDDGFAGLRDGFDLIANSIDAYWESMFPELRDSPTPRDAALRRINALLQLQNDTDGLLGDLSRSVFLNPRGGGPISGHDLEMAMLDATSMLRDAASGLNEKEKANLVEKHEALIQRVKGDCKIQFDLDPAVVDLLRTTVNEAKQAFDQMENALNLKLGGNGSGATLPTMARFLQRVVATLETIPVSRSTVDPELAPVTNVTSQMASVELPSQVSKAGGGAIPDRLNSRGCRETARPDHRFL